MAASILNQQGFMEEPMCFIENKPDQKLYVNQEALKILQSFEQPLVVVAIVGTYRTGKSYLMNRLAGKSKGFSLGATVQANTKGIWMWCCKHPEKPDHVLVLLDTEGLGDVEKSNTENDSWIFALSVLLSSTFVYNSLQTIDQDALERLHYVTELCEHIQVKTSLRQNCEADDEFLDDFVWYFPTFIWTVRDFSLILELNGCPISEDEYLEHALRTRKDAPEAQDLTKKCLREYFPTRKCFVFDRPALSRKDLAHLDDLPESKLNPEFLEQAECFCQYIYRNAQPKMIPGGYAVTGTLLGTLAATYVDAIRSGAVPCIENAVVTLAKIENSAAVLEALQRYDEMVGLFSKLPMEMEDVLHAHARCEEESIEVFMNRTFKDEDHEYQRHLGNELHTKLLELCSRNEQVSSDRCQAVLMELFQNMEEDARNGIYAVPGGYQRFLDEQQKILAQYDSLPDKGVLASKAREDYLKSKEGERQAILHADQNLTAKEKEVAVEQARAEAAEREAALRRKQKDDAERMIRENERSFEEHKRQLTLKMEQEKSRLMARHDAILNQRLQEARRCQEEGSREQLLSLQQQIDQLRQQQSQPTRRGSSCSIS